MQQNTVQMKRVLNTPALVFFGLAYMVPLGIFTTYGQVTVLSEGHLPVAYIITLTAVLFTALSYCKMTSTLPLAGSAYSYVQKIFGGNTGFLVGWAQLLDYLFLPIINYIAIGIFVHEALPSVPMELIIVSTIVIVSVLNILGIKLVTSMNMLIIVMQLIFITLFLYLSFSSAFTLDKEALLAPLTVMSDQVSGCLPVRRFCVSHSSGLMPSPPWRKRPKTPNGRCRKQSSIPCLLRDIIYHYLLRRTPELSGVA